ncbi:MAG: metallopeptidase family protein [Candidatus Binatia bacterium]|nr:metallopeptidase family protein [Candidatus Binatia bacterium]
MERDRFIDLVQEVWEQFPEPFASKLENVVLIVEDAPSPELLRSMGLNPRRDTLFGLYRGVPLPQRGATFANHPPDTITIFYRPLVQRFHTETQLRREIARTIIHEVAHHFGMSEAEIRKLGY